MDAGGKGNNKRHRIRQTDLRPNGTGNKREMEK